MCSLTLRTLSRREHRTGQSPAGALRYALRLDGFAAFDARSARSIFGDVHAAAENRLNFIRRLRGELCEAVTEKHASAPVRAVDVAEGNIAQPEFISGEHFIFRAPKR